MPGYLRDPVLMHVGFKIHPIKKLNILGMSIKKTIPEGDVNCTVLFR